MVGPVVSDRQLDLAGVKSSALDGQLLHGRTVSLTEPWGTQECEGGNGSGDQRQRDRTEGPGGQMRARRWALGGSARLQLAHLEEAEPAQLCELGLVGMEHVAATMGEAQLEDSALPLCLHDRVGVLDWLQ